MPSYTDFFKGKRVTVMGLGLLGRGVGDVRFLAEAGANLIVTDLKSEEELASSLRKLKDIPNIVYHLGGHQLEDFRDRDLILKGPNVPLNSPYIQEAHKNSIPVRMSADLLVELARVKTVGVTGTRGKSTVTHIIAYTLALAGKHVLLGGNVRGVSNLALLPEVLPDSVLVLELDSWQLQGFGEAKISPNIAVFTNLKQDHLNYYPNEATYFADKANIFKFQKKEKGDVLIAGQGVVNMWIHAARPPVAPKVPAPGHWNLKVIGEHNKENAALAAEALRAIGLTEEQIKTGLESFEPVEGRLQFVCEINGVRIYNDNNSTTPDATIAALAALSSEGFAGKIVLIVGGADKGLQLKMLAEMIKEKALVSAAILLRGTGTEKLKPFLNGKYLEVSSMSEAVKVAMGFAQNQKVILFSPAFASFGMFKNEYDRGDQFVKLVQELKA